MREPSAAFRKSQSMSAEGRAERSRLLPESSAAEALAAHGRAADQARARSLVRTSVELFGSLGAEALARRAAAVARTPKVRPAPLEVAP